MAVTKKELYELAGALDIPGRSRMSKDELESAVAATAALVDRADLVRYCAVRVMRADDAYSGAKIRAAGSKVIRLGKPSAKAQARVTERLAALRASIEEAEAVGMSHEEIDSAVSAIRAEIRRQRILRAQQRPPLYRQTGRF